MPPDLARLYQAFDPSPLTAKQQPELYVDLSTVRGDDEGKAVATHIADHIRLCDRDQGPTCCLFSGHSGSGKSTELHRLRKELADQSPKFFAVYVDVDESLDRNDLDYLDLLLSMIHEVAVQLRGLGIELKKGYFASRYQELREFLGSNISFEEWELETGLGKLVGTIQSSPDSRLRIRAALEPKSDSLLHEANEVIGEAKQRLKDNGYAGLVILVDNTDKMSIRSGDASEKYPGETLFVRRYAQISKLECHVLYTVPLALTYSVRGRDLQKLYGWEIPIVGLTKLVLRDGKLNQKGTECFREVIRRRLDWAHCRKDEVFADDMAQDAIISLTGGQPHELCVLMRDAIIRGLPIRQDEVRALKIKAQRPYYRWLERKHWEVIQRVRAGQQPILDDENRSVIRDLLDGRALLFYRNDREWLGVSPLVGSAPEGLQAMIGNAGNDARPEPRPDLESELSGLAAALAVARGGFTIIVAVTNSVPARNRVIERLKEHCPGIVTVELTSEVDDAFDKAVSQAASLKPEALCLVGLELPLLSPERGPVALTAFNAARDLWPKRFSCPIIFWLSDAALHAVIRGAPDFWSRKSHLFEFEEPSGETQSVWSSPQSSQVDDMAIWSDERRRARIAELTARLVQLSTDRPAKQQPQKRRWLEELGFLRYSLGEYGAAAEAFADAATLAREELDWSEFASHSSWMAHTLGLSGKLNEAREALEVSLRHLTLQEKAHLSESASVLSTLAMIQKAQGDLSGARANMNCAIELLEKQLDKVHPNLATVYSNLALIQEDQGDLQAARANMERAIEIDRAHFAADHPRLATSYANLAMIQKVQGDLPAARTNIERAISISEKYRGKDHPNLAILYSNLAMIQQDQNHLAAARANMERAIEIGSKHFPADHPNLAIRYSNLATIQQNQGDLLAARENMERAIQIAHKHFPGDHPALAVSYSNLASIQQDQGDLPAARANLERAIEIERNHFAADHPKLATRYHNLAGICFAKGDGASAAEWERKALEILLKHFNDEHPHVKISRRGLALYEMAANKLVKPNHKKQRTKDKRK